MGGTLTTSEAIGLAALAEFTAFGYRRTSIESIARRADVSRATVYAHWSSKEELFRALVSRLHEDHLAQMQAVADDPDLDIETRITKLLRARFLQFVELTSGSPYAAELYDRHGTLCGEIARTANERAEKILATALKRAVKNGEIDLAASGLTVAQLAGVLTDCAHGAKGEDPAAASPADFTTRLANSVRVIITGVGTAPSR
ncbi:MAG: TetR/AcrR family transcriptional regulator [Mycobacterium sp.]|nr:TetR/AcrR family transcriptional regulator [Mycobacterium sp.]